MLPVLIRLQRLPIAHHYEAGSRASQPHVNAPLVRHKPYPRLLPLGCTQRGVVKIGLLPLGEQHLHSGTNPMRAVFPQRGT